MAKRKRENNEKQNSKKKKEGRGDGHFDKYKPWLRVQDVASHGLSTRVKGQKTGRIHHFLSTLELEYFYLLEWSEEIIDIREQYPLDLSETIALAKELNLAHPPRTDPNNPAVMTSDFLLTVRQSIGTKEVSRTVKYSKDLTNRRTLEKLEIERLYWKERKIDWGIITEQDVNKTVVKNLKWLFPFQEASSLPSLLTSAEILRLTKYLLPIIRKKETPLRIIANSCDKEFKIPAGSSLALIRHLLASKKWEINIEQPIQPENPLPFVSVK